MTTTLKTLALFSFISCVVLVYSAIVAYYLAKDDRRTDDDRRSNDENYF